jgi:hypothetical protein
MYLITDAATQLSEQPALPAALSHMSYMPLTFVPSRQGQSGERVYTTVSKYKINILLSTEVLKRVTRGTQARRTRQEKGQKKYETGAERTAGGVGDGERDTEVGWAEAWTY